MPHNAWDPAEEADDADLQRIAREAYVRGLPRLLEMAAGATRGYVLDPEGTPVEVGISFCDRIAAFNELVRAFAVSSELVKVRGFAAFNELMKGGLGTSNAARETEILAELRSKLEIEVREHLGLTLEEAWAQCPQAQATEGED